jgi:hypothetical protein
MAQAAGAGATLPAMTGVPMTGAGPANTPATGAGAGFCATKAVLDARCTVCHNEQKLAGAPMSLKTYADLQAPAVSDPTKKVYELVKLRVHDKKKPMPPQDPLTPQQLADIDAWVDGGALAGADPTCPDNAKPTEAKHEWPTNCDEVYKIYIAPKENPHVVEAGAETHPQIAVTPPWGNEEVQAIAWHSMNDNLKVLHHWILYGPQREFLFGWAPGKDYNEPLPDDVGVFLPSGNMNLDVHYNNVSGKTSEKDASGVEICALKKPHLRPKTATTTNALASALINLPPHSTNVDVTGTCTHTGEPVRLLSVSPHAHRFGQHMKFTVEKANGMSIVMHDMDFHFEEETTYALRPPVTVESGDRIITTCTFSNDSNQTVTFGENNGNEMCFNFALYEPKGALRCGPGISF